MDRQTVSISESTLFLACRKKRDFRYRRMLVPAEEAAPLTLGKSVHVGLEHWYRTFDRVRSLEAARAFLEASAHREEMFPLAIGMLAGYFDRWQGADDF